MRKNQYKKQVPKCDPPPIFLKSCQVKRKSSLKYEKKKLKMGQESEKGLTRKEITMLTSFQFLTRKSLKGS
jgi:hypothetical protein